MIILSASKSVVSFQNGEKNILSKDDFVTVIMGDPILSNFIVTLFF